MSSSTTERQSAGSRLVRGPRHPIRPLLLQGNAEQRHPASFRFHHVQKIVNVGAFLNIVGQVKMGIVEIIILCLRAPRRNADK